MPFACTLETLVSTQLSRPILNLKLLLNPNVQCSPLRNTVRAFLQHTRTLHRWRECRHTGEVRDILPIVLCKNKATKNTYILVFLFIHYLAQLGLGPTTSKAPLKRRLIWGIMVQEPSEASCLPFIHSCVGAIHTHLQAQGHKTVLYICTI